MDFCKSIWRGPFLPHRTHFFLHEFHHSRWKYKGIGPLNNLLFSFCFSSSDSYPNYNTLLKPNYVNIRIGRTKWSFPRVKIPFLIFHPQIKFSDIERWILTLVNHHFSIPFSKPKYHTGRASSQVQFIKILKSKVCSNIP